MHWVCAVESTYFLLDDDGADAGDRHVDSQENWDDILICEGKSAGHALSMTRKQVESIGAPTWETELALSHVASGRADGGGDPPHSSEDLSYWSVYLLTSDAGSDQVKAKDVISCKLASVTWALVFEILCWLHQLHIIFKCLLQHVDIWMSLLECSASSGKYYSCMSTLSNTMREYSSRIRRSMLRRYPDVPGINTLASKIAPRCLVGRWLACIVFEVFLVDRCWLMIHTVLAEVFGQADAMPAAAAAAASAAEQMDDDAVEQTTAYKVRLGRWRSNALKTTSCQRFRLVLESVHKVHLVLQHMSHYCMSHKHPHGPVLAMLWTGTKAFDKELTDLSHRSNWTAELERCAELGVNPATFTALVFFHISTLAVCFQLRIAKVLRSYPLRIFTLVHTYHDIECPMRKLVCAEVLDLPIWILTDSIVKLRDRYRNHFEFGKRKGQLDKHLWDLLLSMGERLRAHTQDIEGANNFLKEVCKRCPWLDVTTLSYRLNIRRKLLGGAAIDKWSRIKVMFDRIRSICLQFFNTADDFKNKPDRFRTPPPDDVVTSWAAPPADESKVWRARFCEQWFLQMKPNGFQHCLSIIEEGNTEGVAYLTCTTHFALVLCVRADLTHIDLTAGTARLILNKPFVLHDSVSVISALYAEVENPPHWRVYFGHMWSCEFGCWESDTDTPFAWGRAILTDPVEVFKMDAVDAYLSDEDGDDGGDDGDGGGGPAPGAKRTKSTATAPHAAKRGRGGHGGRGGRGGRGGSEASRGHTRHHLMAELSGSKVRKHFPVNTAFADKLDTSVGNMGDGTEEEEALTPTEIDLADQKHADKKTNAAIGQLKGTVGHLSVTPAQIAPELAPEERADRFSSISLMLESVVPISNPIAPAALLLSQAPMH